MIGDGFESHEGDDNNNYCKSPALLSNTIVTVFEMTSSGLKLEE